MERRLVAIMAADVVGYSKLMSEDEAGTLDHLKTHRAELFDPKIAGHNGRIIKLMGDGTLVEFASVLDAVNCAVEIQKELALKHGPIQLRIGINLGDVIVEGDDIYGDGVNVASRLEGLADPGGICVASIVHESLGNRVDIKFADAGEHEIKNIDRPIKVFKWPNASHGDILRKKLVPVEVKRNSTITIMAFQNLSSDEQLEFFCEGLSQDIATALGNIEQLTVLVGSNIVESSKHTDFSDYSLTGKVQSAGNRMRVSVRLIENATGRQIWMDRFDRNTDDLFDVQDDLARNIVIAIHTELGAGSYTNRWQWGTENFEAWQSMAKGFREFQKFSPESLERAAEFFEKALIVDPDYSAPLLASSYCYGHLAWIKEGEEKHRLIDQAETAVKRATEIAPDDLRQYAAKRAIEFARENFEGGVAAAEEALEIAPNDSYTRATLGFALTVAGRPDEALVQMRRAANDMHSPPGWFRMAQIQCLYMLGNLSEALRIGRETVSDDPELYATPAFLAAIASDLNLPDEAKKMREKMLDLDPQFSSRRFVKWIGLSESIIKQKLLSALQKAGLPA